MFLPILHHCRLGLTAIVFRLGETELPGFGLTAPGLAALTLDLGEVDLVDELALFGEFD